MPVQLFPIGDREYRIRVDETGADADTEVVIDLPFRKAQLMRHKCHATGGQGPGVSEIQSFLSRAPDAPATDRLSVEFQAVSEDGQSSGDILLDVQPTWPVLMYCGRPEECFPTSTQGRLYWRPTPNRDDVTIAAEFILREGWPPSTGS